MKRIILVIIFVLSSISLILNLTSIATNEWIVATATLNGAAKPSIINYGLFSGYLENYMMSSPFKYDLTATCNYDEGKCMYSCHEQAEKRQQELINFINRKDFEPCDTKTDISFLNVHLKSGIAKIAENWKSNSDDSESKEEIYYIGSGYWVCTVMFLIIEILFGTAACVFAIMNILWNPVEPILNIFGLYIWNSIAACSGLLTMIVWGALFDTTLKHNIAITDTLRVQYTYNSNDLAKLGYSYFILLLGILFNSINIGLLVLRSILLSKVPPPVVIDKGDDTVLTFY